MKLATRIVGVALTATALCGVGVGTASAAIPEGSGSVSATANAADAPTTTVLAYDRVLPGGDQEPLTTTLCPADQPYLVNQKLSPGPLVPNGVHVEGSNAWLEIYRTSQGPGGLATGWRQGVVRNLGPRSEEVTVSIVCTSAAADGYQA